MMNLYREVKEEKPSFAERFSGFILGFQIGFLNKTRVRRKIERAISKVDYRNTEKLKQIENTICKYDLADPQFGKILSKSSLENFVAKVTMNGDKEILSQSQIDSYLRVGKEYEEMVSKRKAKGPKLLSEKEINRLSHDQNKIVENNKEIKNNNEQNFDKN